LNGSTLTISGDYKEDVKRLQDFAQTVVSAHAYYGHVAQIQSIFNYLIHGTDLAEKYPQRLGLARKIHDELFPIAFFARLHFRSSQSVFIQSKIGSQNYDAAVDDRREPHMAGKIKFLEITTLQDKSDSDFLGELTKSAIVSIEGDQEQVDFDRKMFLLRRGLEQKAKKDYPAGTALLVYTDEHRFQKHSVGIPRTGPDWQGAITEIAHEYLPRLGSFADVFIFSKEKIYFQLGDDKTS
jgi:hypothetical protein